MKNIFKLVGTAALVLAAAGCNNDTIEVDNVQHEEYVRNFIKSFGIPDPDHNYAMAKAAGLHVTTRKGGHVTITAVVQGTEYLFADLDVTLGTHAIPVTIPASVKELTVKYDRGIQTVATNATVDLDKAPTASRETAKDDFEVLYGGEYNVYDKDKYGDMVLNPVDNEPPYLFLSLTGVTKTFFDNKVWPLIGKENTDYTYTLNEPLEGEVLRFNSEYPARHETILTCSGPTGYYIFPVYWKTDRDGYKDYEIVVHKATEGYNDLKSKPYVISFADEGDDKTSNPFPYLGYSEEDLITSYIYPYDDHIYPDGAAASTYTTNWNKLKFGGYDDKAFDPSKAKKLISRGVRINMAPTNHYSPGIAFAVRRKFNNGKPGSFVSSAPFYNTHPDAWGENYYDASLHNLYLAASATLRTDMEGYKIDQFIMDKKIDTTYKLHGGEQWPRPDSIPFSVFNGLDCEASKQWFKLRYSVPEILGFSSQPDCPASTDMRDYCDVILLITPYYHVSNLNNTWKGINHRILYAVLPPPMEWTLAAEDLGGSDDWDFNDVVFSFTDVIRNLKSANWLSSQAMASGPAGAGSIRKITIKPKATGGTLPIYIALTAKGVVENFPEMPSDGETMFSVANAALKEAMGISDDNEAHTYIIGQEVHKWLGANSYTQFVNVGSTRSNINVREVEIIVPTDLDLGDEEFLTSQATGPSQTNTPLYGFSVIVDRENVHHNEYDAFADGGKGYKIIDDLVLGEGTYLIGTPNDDKDVNVPQMILVQGDWQWPTERTNILEAYPNFKEWIGDHTNSDWIMNPTEGKVTKK